MAVGYSGTPLAKKLGFAPDMSVVLLDAPPNLSELLGDLPSGVKVSRRLTHGADIVLIFVEYAADLSRKVLALKSAVAPDGMVWVAWPKRASKMPTDLTEDVIRDIVLPTGMVDVKVCAIDATWSGLKLVIRKALR
ncbi:MAG TPA: DUF3052 domain-containing protein [Propionibacteriaceae bacterium]|jgi:hypothetical protein|nr:DUF3052 domain-containing protein [Propionibacteriaceae bacterium]